MRNRSKGIIDLNLYELCAVDNKYITDVSFMKNLRKLNANGLFCGIDQNGIAGLDLTELNISDNTNITDISFMKNLHTLRVSKSLARLCEINQAGITGLNLWALSASNNPKIVDVSFMNNLHVLLAIGLLKSSTFAPASIDDPYGSFSGGINCGIGKKEFLEIPI